MLIEESVEKILDAGKNRLDAVMVQGEFTLVYGVVNRLKNAGIKVVSACSERKAIEYQDEYGNDIKENRFSFVRFREYR